MLPPPRQLNQKRQRRECHEARVRAAELRVPRNPVSVASTPTPEPSHPPSPTHPPLPQTHPHSKVPHAPTQPPTYNVMMRGVAHRAPHAAHLALKKRTFRLSLAASSY